MILSSERESKKSAHLLRLKRKICYLCTSFQKVTEMGQITKAQRYTIFVMYQKGYSRSSIAEAIGKDKSVISRELKRNANSKGQYVLTTAQQLADIRKERLKRKRKLTSEVTNRINRYLRREQWSPEQIVGYCERQGYNMVHKSLIYEYIRRDKESGGDLWKYCRHKLKKRRRHVGKCPQIKERKPISELPQAAKNKEFGHWQLDLIVGPQNRDAMVTLTEVHTNLSLIRKARHGKNAMDIADLVVEMLRPYRKAVYSTLTDNGSEFADYKYIERHLKTQVYFADPYSSWQKGAVEYANKLYRQYIPKDANFDDFTDEQIKQIQDKINRRPRAKLNFNAPLTVFNNKLLT